MKNQIKEKTRAACKHFFISALIITCSLFLIKKLWYPDQFFYIMNAEKVFFILAATDITIGPALTFIIYKKEKNSLRKDLTAIAIIQTIALALGIKTLAEARPIWIVYNYGVFDIVRANDVFLENTSDHNLILSNSWTGPALVAARLPQSNSERTKILFDTLSGKPDISKNPKYFTPIESAWKEIKATAISERSFETHNAYSLPVTGSAIPSIAIVYKTQEPKIRIIQAP